MATYNKTKQDSVKDAIKSYTNDYLDNYTQQDVLNQAITSMADGKTAIEVADAVYDYVYNNNCDNIVISTALKQCMPKDVLLVLRQEIIRILK